MIVNSAYRIINRMHNVWYQKVKMPYILSLFNSCGKNVIVSEGCIIAGYKNISIGCNSYIGPECLFYSTKAKLIIGNDVIFGPRVSIVTGDHRFDIIGKLIRESTAKLPENDLDVTINDDCWIGMNATILKGVTVGRGSIIAASAVVTKDVEPYSIYISRNNILRRFTDEQIKQHEALLKKR